MNQILADRNNLEPSAAFASSGVYPDFIKSGLPFAGTLTDVFLLNGRNLGSDATFDISYRANAADAPVSIFSSSSQRPQILTGTASKTKSGLSFAVAKGGFLSVDVDATGDFNSLIGLTVFFIIDDGTSGGGGSTIEVDFVQAFGGVGDGTTDNTAAFAAAMNLDANKYQLFIPAGNYKTGKINWDGYLNIRGVGASTVIKSKNAEPLIECLKTGFLKEGGTIENLKLDGNSLGTTGLNVQGLLVFYFQRLKIVNFTNAAMDFKGCLVGFLEQVYAQYCGNGLMMDNHTFSSEGNIPCNLVSLKSCLFGDIAGWAINGNGMDTLLVDNCDIEFCGTNGDSNSGGIAVTNCGEGIGLHVTNNTYIENTKGLASIYIGQSQTNYCRHIIDSVQADAKNATPALWDVYFDASGTNKQRLSIRNSVLKNTNGGLKVSGNNAFLEIDNSYIPNRAIASGTKVLEVTDNAEILVNGVALGTGGGTTIPAGDLNTATNKVEKIQGRAVKYYAPSATFNDDFSTVNSAVWETTYNDGAVVLTADSSGWHFTPPSPATAAQYLRKRTVNSFDFTNRFIKIAISQTFTQVANGSTSPAYFDFLLELANGDLFYFLLVQSQSLGVYQFVPYTRISSVDANTPSSIPLTAQELRLRHNSTDNKIYFEWFNGTVWTNAFGQTYSSSVASAKARITAGITGAGAVGSMILSSFQTDIPTGADSISDKSVEIWNAATNQREFLSLANLKAALNAI